MHEFRALMSLKMQITSRFLKAYFKNRCFIKTDFKLRKNFSNLVHSLFWFARSNDQTN